MATLSVEQGEPSGATACWCCGCSGPEDRMVHLGNHREVAVCVHCAHSLSKWASEIEDRGRSGLGVRARDTFRSARKAVIRRGWQHSPLFGAGIRWMGKRLP